MRVLFAYWPNRRTILLNSCAKIWCFFNSYHVNFFANSYADEHPKSWIEEPVWNTCRYFRTSSSARNYRTASSAKWAINSYLPLKWKKLIGEMNILICLLIWCNLRFWNICQMYIATSDSYIASHSRSFFST